MTDPTVRLQRRIEKLDARIQRFEQISSRLSTFRLLTVLVAVPVLVAIYASLSGVIFWASLLVSSGIFVYSVRRHRRVNGHLEALRIWRDIHATHLARVQLDWSQIPAPFWRAGREHPLETDLDLQRLHQLLNVATSVDGAARLREWLASDAPDLQGIQTRQQRTAELMARPAFGDKLVLIAELAVQDLQRAGEGETVLAWLRSQQNPAKIRPTLILLAVLAVVNITVILLTAQGILPAQSPTVTLALYAAVFIMRQNLMGNIFEEALTLQGGLERINAVMRYLERDRYAQMPSIRELCTPIVEQRPSRQLRRATWVVSGVSLRANIILWMLINVFVPWDYFFAYRLERLKAELTEQLPGWLDIWHEVEALSSLALYGHLHPQATYPDIQTEADPVFVAKNIGHPLIPASERVHNEFHLDHLGDIVLVTGSNMSGKSSFLRTLGVNLCLAYAGGPVLADHLQTVPFRLFSVIRVTDSLDEGMSFFYAEVRRLKTLLDTLDDAESAPVFFLIDEIFRGTNNRERLIGSRATIQALVQRRGVGVISTHDLELVSLADDTPTIRNHHFREDVADGRMVFDYTLRPGPSPTTNALKIMSMEGLPVPVEEMET